MPKEHLSDVASASGLIGVDGPQPVRVTCGGRQRGRLCRGCGRARGLVGYNVQAAVDTKHHLIVAHEVTNIGNDRSQLSTMGTRAGEAMGKTALTVLADRSYFDGEEIRACTEAGHVPLVPKPPTSGASGLSSKFADRTARCFSGSRRLFWSR